MRHEAVSYTHLDVYKRQGKLLVVADIELLDVHLGEDVERRLGLDRGDAVDREMCIRDSNRTR